MKKKQKEKRDMIEESEEENDIQEQENLEENPQNDSDENQDEEEEEDLAGLTQEQYNQLKYQRFGQNPVINKEQLKIRLHEVRQNFFNRLDSKNLIKKFGKIPFTEHLTVQEDPKQKDQEVQEGVQTLQINEDLKREFLFYNQARDNVKKGMQILVQAKVPISRPMDFLAEMLKSDEHMLKVKQNLLKQQNKMQKFEEKKSKQESKKFHKAVKQFTQEKRHKEKRENLNAIQELKSKIKEKGGDIDEKEFKQIMMKTGSKAGMDHQKGEKPQKRTSVMDKIKGNGSSTRPVYPRAKKGESDRIGKGRFNRQFAQERQKLLNGEMPGKNPSKKQFDSNFSKDRGYNKDKSKFSDRGSSSKFGNFKKPFSNDSRTNNGFKPKFGAPRKFGRDRK